MAIHGAWALTSGIVVAKTGILGGTFDPVHVAHLAVAERARVQCGLDRVLFVPAWIAPHKLAQGAAASADHRLAMLRLALEGNPAFATDECELRRGGTSYTIDTLADLRVRYGSDEQFVLIIGADNYAIFRSWRAADTILAMCTVAVYERPGTELGALEPGFVRIEGPASGLTSTWIRQQAGAGVSIRYCVPEAVERYIADHRLYHITQRG